MEKTAFVSVSYEFKGQLAAELEAIATTLKGMTITPVVFVNAYRFEAGQEREMMSTALKLIQGADLLIAEVSHKAIGVGIEIGYAAAMGKPIVYLRKKDSPYSTTVGGLAACAIEYDSVADLQRQLTAVISRM